jgi:hypothetical protein
MNNKSFLTLILMVALMSSLVACNVSGTTSNQVDLDNPFGLKGQAIKLSRVGETTSVTWQGGFTDLPILDDLDTKTKIPELYRGFTPGRLLERLGFETIMEATSKAGQPQDFPDTFTFSAPKLQLTIKDGSGAPSVSPTLTSKGDLTVTFSNKTCERRAVDTFCTYSTTFSDAFLDFEYGGPDFTKFYNDIWTAGSSPNTLSATFTLNVTGTGGLLGFPPSDTEATLKLRSLDGKLVF